MTVSRLILFFRKSPDGNEPRDRFALGSRGERDPEGARHQILGAEYYKG